MTLFDFKWHSRTIVTAAIYLWAEHPRRYALFLWLFDARPRGPGRDREFSCVLGGPNQTARSR